MYIFIVADITGKVLGVSTCKPFPNERLVEEVQGWCALEEQPVPPFSAAKQNGQPLYKLARAGTVVERTKSVHITAAKVLDYEHPYLQFSVHCSSGTYIRSLAHSLGQRLGCGAVLTDLVREYSYPFGLEHAVDLDAILQDPKLLLQNLHPIRDAVPDWPAFSVSAMWAKLIRQGQNLPVTALPKVKAGQKQALVLYEECELAIVTLNATGSEWKITRGLWNDANIN